jgi:hypothetical protein
MRHLPPRPVCLDGARRPGVDGAHTGAEVGLGAGGAPDHGRPPAGWRTSPVSSKSRLRSRRSDSEVTVPH